MSGVQKTLAVVGRDSYVPFPFLPTVPSEGRHWAVPSPQPVPRLEVGVSGVAVRAARDKGRLSDARSDLGCPFPDAGAGLIHALAGRRAPSPAAPGRAAPGGRK